MMQPQLFSSIKQLETPILLDVSSIAGQYMLRDVARRCAIYGIPWKGVPSNSRARSTAQEPYFLSVSGNRLLTAALSKYVRPTSCPLATHVCTIYSITHKQGYLVSLLTPANDIVESACMFHCPARVRGWQPCLCSPLNGECSTSFTFSKLCSSAPLGVLRPKPSWGKAWSAICFLTPASSHTAEGFQGQFIMRSRPFTYSNLRVTGASEVFLISTHFLDSISCLA
jgi:hypothetical protein